MSYALRGHREHLAFDKLIAAFAALGPSEEFVYRHFLFCKRAHALIMPMSRCRGNGSAGLKKLAETEREGMRRNCDWIQAAAAPHPFSILVISKAVRQRADEWIAEFPNTPRFWLNEGTAGFVPGDMAIREQTPSLE